jgi:hypothetical protein
VPLCLVLRQPSRNRHGFTIPFAVNLCSFCITFHAARSGLAGGSQHRSSWITVLIGHQHQLAPSELLEDKSRILVSQAISGEIVVKVWFAC